MLDPYASLLWTLRPRSGSRHILVPMSEDRVADYREAYDAWQKQLAGLHDVFLDGNRLDPVRLKGLLNRESRAKRRYDRARLRLLGIEDEDLLLDAPDTNDEDD